MTTGMSAYLANSLLNMLRGTAFTAPTGTFVKLHTADPGVGATAPSAVTTRNAATFAVSTTGALALSTLAGYAMTATETITHISVWDSSTAGNLLWTAPLATPQAVVNTNTLNFNSVPLSLAPLAA